MNDCIPKLLRAIALGSDARENRHDVIFNTAAREIELLRELVADLLDNDPNELAADGGVTVLDVWRKDAARVLGRNS